MLHSRSGILAEAISIESTSTTETTYLSRFGFAMFAFQKKYSSVKNVTWGMQLY